MVPDSLGSLLTDLPILPSRSALLMGWAVDLPTIVQLEILEGKYRPMSEDPSYFKSWTKSDAIGTSWSDITSLWNRDIADTIQLVDDAPAE